MVQSTTIPKQVQPPKRLALTCKLICTSQGTLANFKSDHKDQKHRKAELLQGKQVVNKRIPTETSIGSTNGRDCAASPNMMVSTNFEPIAFGFNEQQEPFGREN